MNQSLLQMEVLVEKSLSQSPIKLVKRNEYQGKLAFLEEQLYIKEESIHSLNQQLEKAKLEIINQIQNQTSGGSQEQNQNTGGNQNQQDNADVVQVLVLKFSSEIQKLKQEIESLTQQRDSVTQFYKDEFSKLWLKYKEVSEDTDQDTKE